MNENIEISIDYLTFTVKSNHKPDVLIESILGMDASLFTLTRGVNFYRSSMMYSNIRICFNGNGYGDYDMGVCFILSAQGLRTFEEYTATSALTLLEIIHGDPNIGVSRVDIACDDKSGVLDMDTMWDFAKNDSYRTRLVSKSFHESKKGENDGAKTIYFGAPKSLTRIRIYDKAKEHYDPDREPDLYNSHWIRFEITLKGYYAQQAVDYLVNADSLGETVSGIIADKFNFINRDNDNISRCTMPEWWHRFLGQVGAVKLVSMLKPEHIIDTHADWLRYSVSRILAKVIEAIGEDAFINHVLEYGKSKLTDADKTQIKDYQESKRVERWEPVFGRQPRKPKRLGEKYKPPQRMGDLWYGEDFAEETPEFIEIERHTIDGEKRKV